MRALALVSMMVCLGLAAQLVRPTAVAACSWPADSIMARDTPANGVVIVRAECVFGSCFVGELPAELPVVDFETRLPIPGEIVRMEGGLDRELVIAWRPEQPLTLGRSYEVLWQPEALQDFAELDFVFEATSPLTWTIQDLEVATEFSLGTQSEESISCEAIYTDSCGGHTSSVTFSERSHVSLSVPVHVARPTDYSEYLYVIRATFWTEGSEPSELAELSWIGREDAWHAFEEAADAYCYLVEVTSLVDDSVVALEGCHPHGGFGELGTTRRSDENIAVQLGSCLEVVEGYEVLWCQGRRASCAEAEANAFMQPGCDTLDTDCDAIEAANPTDPMVDPSDPTGEPTDPRVDPLDPTDDPSDPNDDPADPTDHPSDPSTLEDPAGEMGDDLSVSRGCSVSSSKGVSHAWLLLIAVGVVLVRRARRRAE